MEIRKVGVKKLSFDELKLKLKCNYSEKKKTYTNKSFFDIHKKINLKLKGIFVQ